MTAAKISIITPSLNQGQFIEETINSVLNQNYPNLEYIIIDGGSTDNTLEIIKKYQKHLSFWISEKDSGQSDAINKGLQKCTGEIFNWLNGDDYYNKDTLSVVSEIFQRTKCDVVAGRSQIFSELNSKIINSYGTDIYPQLSKTIGWGRIDQPATFFKKSLIEEIGMMNIKLHYTMDREWWIKYLLLHGQEKVSTSDKAFVNFRLHNNSKTVSQSEKFEIERDSIFYSIADQFGLTNIKNAIEDICTIDKSYFFTFNGTQDPKVIQQSLNYFLLLKGNELYIKLDKEKASKCFMVIDSLPDKKDQQYLNVLRYKNNFLPSFLIKIFRKK